MGALFEHIHCDTYVTHGVLLSAFLLLQLGLESSIEVHEMARIDENIDDTFEGCSGAYKMAKIDENFEDAFEGCSGSYKMVRIDENIEDSFKSRSEAYKMGSEDVEDTFRSCSGEYEIAGIEENSEDNFENGTGAYTMVRIGEDSEDDFKSHIEAYRMAGTGGIANRSEFDQLLIVSDEEEIGTSDDETVRGLVHNVELKSDGDESDSESVSSWSSDFSPHDPWVFSGDSGPHGAIYNCEKPIDFYCLFLNDEILRLIVDETNRYGNNQSKEFQNTDKDEMKRFIGLCLQMGLVQMPYLENYWSSRPAFGGQSFAGKIMRRKRFEELLKHLHLANNDNFDGNRLYKIEKFVDLFNKAAVKWYSLGKELCIDQSLIPLQEISSMQYMPFEDIQECVIRLFKLCDKGGYTGRIKIYAGKDPLREGSVAEEVVLNLMEGYLDKGRILCTYKFFSSVGLAERLISRKTHLLGTLKRKGKGIPVELKETKLKKGQLCYKQKRSGVLVLKWRDKRDLYMISTKHDAGMGMSQKPDAVETYSEMKAFVNHSNYTVAYTPFVRKSTKWYKKIFFHLITNTAMTNAWKLYKDVMGNVRLDDFRMDVIDSLLYDEHIYTPSLLVPTRHELEEMPGSKTDKRRRCSGCYAKLAKEQGRATAMKRTKMVNTRCNRCQKYFCLKCFNKKHNL